MFSVDDPDADTYGEVRGKDVAGTLRASERCSESSAKPHRDAAPPTPPSTRTAARRSMEIPSFMTVLL